MLEKLIGYFAKRKLLGNLIYAGVILGAFFAVSDIQKEDMPNIVMDFVLVSTSYPGASPEEVEYFVTRELEDRIKGIDGVGEVSSTSAFGSSSVRIELLPDIDRETAINEIRTAVSDARLPAEVIDNPRVREFKASQRSIIQIGMFYKDVHLLDDEKRSKLQKYVLMLEDAVLNLPEINSVNRSFYRNPEINVEADPEKMRYYNIPLSRIISEIRASNARIPAGSLEDPEESKVTLYSELDTAEKIKNVIARAGFEGRSVSVRQVANVRETFRSEKTIQKLNGREGVRLTVVKNANAGILEATDAVRRAAGDFAEITLKGTPFETIMLRDNSYDVRNRLSIILNNGAIGMALIIIMLLLVLNLRTAFWVAVGIPFTFAFTVIAAAVMGYTMNNITLAAVIIVMGMIVDDAIIVAENISRSRAQGMGFYTSSVKGTVYVLKPVFAGVLTTCAAFLPFFMFEGRFGKMLEFLPPVVFMMLAASLIESLFILPGHMNERMPAWMSGVVKKLKRKSRGKAEKEVRAKHWFLGVEEKYGKFLGEILKRKGAVFIIMILLFAAALSLVMFKMKFVMFPNEETQTVILMGETEPGTVSADTARETVKLENVFKKYLGREVVGIRTNIARSRWRTAEEHKFNMVIEIVPREDRKKSLNRLMEEWEEAIKVHKKDFKKLSFARSWWGQDSGTPVVILLRENNEKTRREASRLLEDLMKKNPALADVEIDKVVMNPEYRIEIDREKAARLGVTADNIQRTLRAAVEGAIVYEIKGETEQIRVRVTTPPGEKAAIKEVMNMPVENRGNYLVPLKSVVTVKKGKTPAQIEREDFRRKTTVYSDINSESGKTPLDIAAELEADVFPAVKARFPSVNISFDGEIKDSRESGRSFIKAVIITLAVIYTILILLFGSFLKPLMIMFTIPFGIVGVVFAFLAHGMTTYGFFSVIGVIGLMGVVVNNSILMLVKLDREYDRCHHKEMSDGQIADIAKTRLQAVLLTTITTVAALFPTAYGVAGYDSMLAEMMLAMGWGLLFGTVITLVLVPCIYGFTRDVRHYIHEKFNSGKNC
ncbi:MAG: efflux RND transporter permease subunit [Candidatus Goldiibacteriota bacterium]